MGAGHQKDKATIRSLDLPALVPRSPEREGTRPGPGVRVRSACVMKPPGRAGFTELLGWRTLRVLGGGCTPVGVGLWAYLFPWSLSSHIGHVQQLRVYPTKNCWLSRAPSPARALPRFGSTLNTLQSMCQVSQQHGLLVTGATASSSPTPHPRLFSVPCLPDPSTRQALGPPFRGGRFSRSPDAVSPLLVSALPGLSAFLGRSSTSFRLPCPLGSLGAALRV